MPGMSTVTPDFQINTRNQQWKHMPGLVLSHGKASSTAQSGINVIRHSQNQTSSSRASSRMSVPISRWCLQVTVWDFTSGHRTPELTQRLLFCVQWHRGIMLRVWNIHAAQVWMKRYILLAPTFSHWGSAEKGPPWGWNKSTLWMLFVCQALWATHPPQKTGMHIFWCTQRHACAHNAKNYDFILMFTFIIYSDSCIVCWKWCIYIYVYLYSVCAYVCNYVCVYVINILFLTSLCLNGIFPFFCFSFILIYILLTLSNKQMLMDALYFYLWLKKYLSMV